MFLLVISLIGIVIVEGAFCNKKKSGFYCDSDHTYLWCYGNPQPSTMTCAPGTSCQCGYSSFNPCGFHSQVLEDCEGSFQDNITPPTPSPSPPSQQPSHSDDQPNSSDKPQHSTEETSFEESSQNTHFSEQQSETNDYSESLESESFEEIDYCS